MFRAAECKFDLNFSENSILTYKNVVGRLKLVDRSTNFSVIFGVPVWTLHNYGHPGAELFSYYRY